MAERNEHQLNKFNGVWRGERYINGRHCPNWDGDTILYLTPAEQLNGDQVVDGGTTGPVVGDPFQVEVTVIRDERGRVVRREYTKVSTGKRY